MESCLIYIPSLGGLWEELRRWLLAAVQRAAARFAALAPERTQSPESRALVTGGPRRFWTPTATASCAMPIPICTT